MAPSAPKSTLRSAPATVPSERMDNPALIAESSLNVCPLAALGHAMVPCEIHNALASAKLTAVGLGGATGGVLAPPPPPPQA